MSRLPLFGVRPRTALTFALASLLLVSISAVLAHQLGYAPDQGSHVFVVDHYASSFAPLGADDMATGGLRGHAYYLLSPLPYLPYVPFAWLQDLVGPVASAERPDGFVLRLGGLPIVVAQLGVTALIVRRLTTRLTGVQVVVLATVVNLVPQLRYLHAYVNPDGVAVLAGSVGFLAALRLVQVKTVRPVDGALAGGAVTFLALSRLNTLPIAAVVLAVLVVRLLRQDERWADRLRVLGIALAIPAVLAGAFHLAVYAYLDNGQLLPTDTVMQLGDSTFAGEIADAPPLGELVRIRAEHVDDFWGSTWLWFTRYAQLGVGWLVVLAAGCLVGTAGLLVPGGGILERRARVVALLAVTTFGVTYLAIASQWLYGQQGRFLLPAGVTAFAGVVVGTASILSRSTRPRAGVLAAAGLWGAVLLGLDLWGIARVF